MLLESVPGMESTFPVVNLGYKEAAPVFTPSFKPQDQAGQSGDGSLSLWAHYLELHSIPSLYFHYLGEHLVSWACTVLHTVWVAMHTDFITKKKSYWETVKIFVTDILFKVKFPRKCPLWFKNQTVARATMWYW